MSESDQPKRDRWSRWRSLLVDRDSHGRLCAQEFLEGRMSNAEYHAKECRRQGEAAEREFKRVSAEVDALAA